MRIGIIRLGSLGDILHTLPALSALRRKFPRDGGGPSGGNRIEWLVESAHASFLAGHPLLDDLHVMDTRRWRRLRRGAAGPVDAVRRVRRSRFDVALDFQGLLKSAILARLSGAKKRIGFDSDRCREPAASVLYTHPVAPPSGAEHAIERNLSLLGPLGIERDIAIEFPLALTESDRRMADTFFADRGWTSEVPVVAICPGAGWETKRWGVERFAALGDRIAGDTGAKLLVVRGKDEGPLAEALRANFRAPAEVIPPTSVREMAAFLERCRMFIGGDTGPLHLAAALGVPTVALMGPTTPSRNGPLGPGPPGGGRGTVVHHELPCSHCYKKTCPGFGIRCLTEITPAEAAGRALELWADRRTDPPGAIARAGIAAGAEEKGRA